LKLDVDIEKVMKLFGLFLYEELSSLIAIFISIMLH